MENKITIIILKIINKFKFYLNYLFKFISQLYLSCLSSGENKFKNAYLLPFIFAKLNPNITPETEPIVTYAFSMFILNLAVLICFFNIAGYILSIYLVNKYDIETKFPKFKRYINFYKSTSKFFLVLEIIIEI